MIEILGTVDLHTPTYADEQRAFSCHFSQKLELTRRRRLFQYCILFKAYWLISAEAFGQADSRTRRLIVLKTSCMATESDFGYLLLWDEGSKDLLKDIINDNDIPQIS